MVKTKLILVTGIVVYSELSEGEIRTYLQKGVKTGSLIVYLTKELDTSILIPTDSIEIVCGLDTDLSDMEYKPIRVQADGSIGDGGGSTGNVGVIQTNIVQSDIMVPVELQGSFSQVIQTHNAVNVSTSSRSSWQLCDGFDKIGLTLSGESGKGKGLVVYWSNDGVSYHGREEVLTSDTNQYTSASVYTKAKYFLIEILNTESTAQVMSSWSYLKA